MNNQFGRTQVVSEMLAKAVDARSNVMLKKILVPVKNEQTAEMLVGWLEKNPESAQCDLMLVHLVEPKWWTDMPYSGAAALLMTDEHEEALANGKELLMALSSRLAKHHPGVRTSWQVLAASVEGQSISQVAIDWIADRILLFAKPQKGKRLFGGGLIKQIKKSARCDVQVIQSLDTQLSPDQVVREQEQTVLPEMQYQTGRT
jgi:hypothetical protein